MADHSRSQAMAVVGMSGRFPGAPGLDGFWQTIRDGVEVLETFDDADLDAARVDAALRDQARYVRKGTVLPDADAFDASFFGVPPRDAQILDPQQRIFLECAWEALEHAGYAGAAAGQSIGVYAGVGMNTYFVTQILSNPAFVASAGGYQLMVGSDKDFLSTRVSYKLDLRGPSFTVQTACSTSLVAIVLASRALQSGECDMALAGGVSIMFPQRAGYLYEEGMILSPDGHCRPFDAQAKGTRSGGGAGVVVLKRLSAAIEDRDTIHAVILGAAVNNDGAGKAGYTAPSVEGQVEVIATAHAVAGVEARSIGYVEAHGTATPLGDPIEIAALTQAFRASTRDVGFCRIGSLKANLGHLDAAAGVASFIKAILVMKHRELPPLVNFRSANPALGLESSPFVASASRAPWPATDGAPRRAGVSSFGIGGTNAHVVLEEAPAPISGGVDGGPRLLVLSAKSAPALDRSTANFAAYLRAHPQASMADVAWTLGVGRQAFTHRRAVVVRDAEHAIAVLAQPDRPPVMSGSYDGGARPVAFLFSGQGSQYAGMGAGLYREHPVYRDAVDRCAAALEPHVGSDIRATLFAPAGDAAVHETRTTQPALFVTGYALASLWQSWGIVPSTMIGHSVGEYVAAHLAGVMSLDDALRVVAVRGRLMQAQAPGSMAAVSLSSGELEPQLHDGVEIAAFNAPGLCSIAGPSSAVQKLLEHLRARGVECRELRTSHAFHSAMMAPVMAPLAAAFEGVKLSPPAIPYVSNLTGTWITPAQATSPAYYADHLRQAVRFEAGVRTLAADPAPLLLEVGPGNALTTLARMTLGRDGARRAWAALPHAREDRSDREAVLEAAGRLWLVGASFTWKRFQADPGSYRVPLPTYPFERKRFWVDAQPVSAPAAELRSSARVDDWFFAPTWTRDDSLDGKPPAPEATWLVYGATGRLSESVVRCIKERAGAAVLVEEGDKFEHIEATRFRVRPGSVEDLTRLVREVRGARGRVAGAIVLSTAQPDEARRPTARYYHSIVALAEALDPAFDGGRPARIVAATCGAASVLDEPIRDFTAAMAIGPAIVLPTEVPGLQVRAVDVAAIDAGDAVGLAASQLVREAAAADDETVVAWRAGRRWVRRFERVALPAGDPGSLPLKPRGVYLITGGLGGIGLTLAKWLAAQTSARLVLTGRTAPPDRERWPEWLATHRADDRHVQAIEAIREIERSGGEAMFTVADAADEVAMRAAVERASARWGAIDGVIHGAGVPGTGSIAFRKTVADVDAAMAPKVDGLDVLTRILGNAPLDFVALFSSINAVLGAPGACDYAAANAVLGAFVDAASRPAKWSRIVAIDWGAWRDVGMAANLVAPAAVRREREALLQHAIPPSDGIDAFARVLASAMRRVIVTSFDSALARDSTRRGSAKHESAAARAPVRHEAASAQERPELSSAYEAPSTDVERALTDIWRELLGVDQIGANDDFFELGGHSLLATRVLARIDVTLKARLTLRDIFDAPTIRELAAKVTGPAGADEDREEIEF
jgi:phthiocerol/phenolphthiocerol synthesis type-I polyketide synthase E